MCFPGSRAGLTLGPPPCIFRARTVATSTTTLGTKPEARHLMLKNFSMPISAPKPASVTVENQVGHLLLSSNSTSKAWPSLVRFTFQGQLKSPTDFQVTTQPCISFLFSLSFKIRSTSIHSPKRWLSASHHRALRILCQGLDFSPGTGSHSKAFLNTTGIFNFLIRFQMISKNTASIVTVKDPFSHPIIHRIICPSASGHFCRLTKFTLVEWLKEVLSSGLI